jgi:alkanesulfonate monooxygenase SsuD/methylene tetrahydromethanopterin reductase-like flavin-dependent oxidoreductase (luciferase family)
VEGRSRPFIALSFAAARTDRLRLITSVLALPRRRPQLVAQAAATLDRWSRGRLILWVESPPDRRAHRGTAAATASCRSAP